MTDPEQGLDALNQVFEHVLQALKDELRETLPPALTEPSLCRCPERQKHLVEQAVCERVEDTGIEVLQSAKYKFIHRFSKQVAYINPEEHQASLRLEDLGESTSKSIAAVLSKAPTSLIKITDIEQLQQHIPAINKAVRGLLPSAIPEEPASLAVIYQAVKSPLSAGVINLFKARTSQLTWPDLDLPLEKPDTTECGLRNALKERVGTAPRSTQHLPYYVGKPFEIQAKFDDILTCGTELRDEFGDSPGITTTYWHVGVKDSGTAFHCEDANFRSCNLTLLGYKLWILINESDTDKFERLLIMSYNPKRFKCDQWVRHENILLDTSVLDNANIGYQILCSGPGDLVLTAPRQYHCVVNLTTSFALSINFLLDEEEYEPPFQTCKECGLVGFECPQDEATQKDKKQEAVAKSNKTAKRKLPEQAARNKRRAKRPRQGSTWLYMAKKQTARRSETTSASNAEQPKINTKFKARKPEAETQNDTAAEKSSASHVEVPITTRSESHEAEDSSGPKITRARDLAPDKPIPCDVQTSNEASESHAKIESADISQLVKPTMPEVPRESTSEPRKPDDSGAEAQVSPAEELAGTVENAESHETGDSTPKQTGHQAADISDTVQPSMLEEPRESTCELDRLGSVEVEAQGPSAIDLSSSAEAHHQEAECSTLTQHETKSVGMSDPVQSSNFAEASPDASVQVDTGDSEVEMTVASQPIKACIAQMDVPGAPEAHQQHTTEVEMTDTFTAEVASTSAEDRPATYQTDTGHYTQAESPNCSVANQPNVVPEGEIPSSFETNPATVFEKQKQKFLEMGLKCNLDICSPQTHPEIMPYIAWNRSESAVKTFHRLVEGSRVVGTMAQRNQVPITVSEARVKSNALLRMAHFLSYSVSAQRYKRISQYLLGKVYFELRGNGLRLPTEVTTQLMHYTGFSNTKLDYEFKQAKKWQRFCGANYELDGLFCFMPDTPTDPFNVSPSAFAKLAPEIRRQMHTILQGDKYTASLCTAGQAFQQSIDGHPEVWFKWEINQVAEPWQLPVEEMLDQLQPYKQPERNTFNLSDFPEGFFGDPTCIKAGTEACSFCYENQPCSCVCYQKVPTSQIRLVRYAGAPLSIVAFSYSGEKVVFTKGDTLGFLTGRLVPETQTTNHAIYVPPGPGCKLDFAVDGNCYSLVGTACEKHATAQLRWRAVSGYQMCAVEAKDTITHHAAITVASGKSAQICALCKPSDEVIAGDGSVEEY